MRLAYVCARARACVKERRDLEMNIHSGVEDNKFRSRGIKHFPSFFRKKPVRTRVRTRRMPEYYASERLFCLLEFLLRFSRLETRWPHREDACATIALRTQGAVGSVRVRRRLKLLQRQVAPAR
jgi:hypothetical protein